MEGMQWLDHARQILFLALVLAVKHEEYAVYSCIQPAFIDLRLVLGTPSVSRMPWHVA